MSIGAAKIVMLIASAVGVSTAAMIMMITTA